MLNRALASSAAAKAFTVGVRWSTASAKRKGHAGPAKALASRTSGKFAATMVTTTSNSSGCIPNFIAQQLDVAFVTLQRKRWSKTMQLHIEAWSRDQFEDLINELKVWCAARGLKHRSPYQLIEDKKLSKAER